MSTYITLENLSRFKTKQDEANAAKFVPKTLTINGKALSGNITLTAANVSAIASSLKGAANGVAELDAAGKVPAAQLPSYVDDVIEGYLSSGKFYSDSAKTAEVTGENGKIYTTLDTNKVYRWSGSAFVEISASLALGETSSTAYRGDRGKIAYDHSQVAHAPADAEKNVQADWNVTDSSSDAFIKNKPTSMPANGGNAATAAKATQDSAGQQITTTYIKGLSVSGRTVTYTKGDGTTGTITTQDTTYSDMTAATAEAAGTHGLVPAPGAGSQAKYLRGDGTWATPTNTTYSNMTGATSSAAGSAGLVPAPGAGKQLSFLRGDGTWVVPTDTKYNVATSSANGLLSAADKAKLDTVEENANYYILPTAGTELGGVKTTSTVTSNSGYTAAPIIDGVVYYKDTNTTYTNMKGATSSAAGSAGLVPAPAAGKQASFLRGDGTWVVPTDTKYNNATTSTAGLMSAADKTKLDGLAEATEAQIDALFA